MPDSISKNAPTKYWFGLVNAKDRAYWFSAETDHDRDQWVHSFSRLIGENNTNSNNSNGNSNGNDNDNDGRIRRDQKKNSSNNKRDRGRSDQSERSHNYEEEDNKQRSTSEEDVMTTETSDHSSEDGMGRRDEGLEFSNPGRGSNIRLVNTKRRERASRNGALVVDISIPPPSCKPVSLFLSRSSVSITRSSFKLVLLSLSRSSVSETPKQVFFLTISNIF